MDDFVPKFISFFVIPKFKLSIKCLERVEDIANRGLSHIYESFQIIFNRNFLKNYEIIFGWRMTEFLYSFWPKILFREKFSKQFLLLMSE